MVKIKEDLVEVFKEQEEVSKEILTANEIEVIVKSLTKPSADALNTPKPNSGNSLKAAKKSILQLFILYLTNQYVSRAINVRADSIISRGYNIIGDDKVGVEKCQNLIIESGGINLFRQIHVNTDIAGKGVIEKLYNRSKTAILKLKHVHPLTIDFKKDVVTDKVIVGKDGEPVGFVQVIYDKKGNEKTIPIKNKHVIEYLCYNTLGDDFTGLSIINSGYDTIVRLMNMEYSAAEAAVKTANPLMIATCNSKSPHQIAQWANILGRISGQEQLFIPEGMTVSMLSPGTQNFNDYAQYFVDSIVAAFGVPRGILLGEGGNTNRAEGTILNRVFYSTIHSLQTYQEDFFNKIFEEYGKLAGFKAPKLVFGDVAEDASLLADSAINLFSNGLISREEARSMIGLEEKGIGSFIQGISAEFKKGDRAVQFPKTEGRKEGSQKGVKKSQLRDPNSMVNKL